MRFRTKGWTILLATSVVSTVLISMVITQNAAPTPAPVQAAPVRTAGKPDFSGIWEAHNTANWDLLTHESRPMVGQPGFAADSVVLAAPVVALGALGWVPAGLGVVEGDQIPYLPWAAARKKENLEHWIDRDPEIK